MPAHRKISDDQVEQAVAMRAAGSSLTEIAAALHVHRSSISRALARPDVASRVKAEARRLRKTASRRVRRQRAQTEAKKVSHDQAHGIPTPPPPAGSEARRIYDERERVRIGDPAEGGGFHTADSLVRPTPTPPPVPDRHATEPEWRPSLPPPPTRRRRPQVEFLSTWATSLMSPLDWQRFSRGGGGAVAGFSSSPPPEDWLEDHDSHVTLRDGAGRVMYVALDSDLHRELTADGWK